MILFCISLSSCSLVISRLILVYLFKKSENGFLFSFPFENQSFKTFLSSDACLHESSSLHPCEIYSKNIFRLALFKSLSNSFITSS